MNNLFRKKILSEDGFAFSATALVVSVVLGVIILFMANTVRMEALRSAELSSVAVNYWEALSDVELAAQLLADGRGSDITSTTVMFDTTDYCEMRIYSLIQTEGAVRAVELYVECPSFSMIEQVSSPPFQIYQGARLDGDIYFGGDVDLPDIFGFANTRIGQDYSTTFYVPYSNFVTPPVPQAGNNYTVKHIPTMILPTFDTTAYSDSLILAGNIMANNIAAGEYFNPDTFSVDIDLGTDYTRRGMIINGDAIFNGVTISNTGGSANNPGFIIVEGDIIFIDVPWVGIPSNPIADNVIIISSGQVELNYTQFGSPNINQSLWKNYSNTIYAEGEIKFTPIQFPNPRNNFGQFYAMGGISVPIMESVTGLIYSPNSSYGLNFITFAGTIYIQSAVNDYLIWNFTDINIHEERLSHYLPGGLSPPSTITWEIVPGSIKEI